ncbi:MAG TPA: FkbM family methyltransferase, partial [Prolixibacteraceae bacterium]|nr:FkbM family methyltransferase [Prolixibacteraceae bacterium]
MTLGEIIKLIWRQILATRELKEMFFHGKSELIENKIFDRLFRIGYKSGVEILYFSTENKKIYLKTKDQIIVSTDYNYNMLIEVLLTKIYTLPPQIIDHEFYVFDIGMNRGYSCLYFAQIENCKKVFGFELDEKPYSWALENFALNNQLNEKIEHFNFGLWNDNKEIEICSYKDDYCNKIMSNSVKNENDKIHRNFSIKKANVKKASDVVFQIFESIEQAPMKIMKIDIEGAEYEVLRDLFENKLIDKFDIIIGECHNGMDEL